MKKWTIGSIVGLSNIHKTFIFRWAFSSARKWAAIVRCCIVATAQNLFPGLNKIVALKLLDGYHFLSIKAQISHFLISFPMLPFKLFLFDIPPCWHNLSQVSPYFHFLICPWLYMLPANLWWSFLWTNPYYFSGLSVHLISASHTSLSLSISFWWSLTFTSVIYWVNILDVKKFLQEFKSIAANFRFVLVVLQPTCFFNIFFKALWIANFWFPLFEWNSIGLSWYLTKLVKIK